jgi:formylglycine-generating enzyme required for sulfatase activity
MKKTVIFIFSILLTCTGFGQAIVDTFTVNGVSFEMVRVEGGKFERGCISKENEECYKREEGRHTVILKDFSIGKYEVTQQLWEAVMGSNPCYFDYNPERMKIKFNLSIVNNLKHTPQNPVDYVSWDDAQAFIDSLNKITGEKFRLPTEAEWEYAARGGKYQENYLYSGSDHLDLVGWYCTDDYSDCGWPKKVGLKKPNVLGLYDMSGNIAEWCSDWYDENYYKTAKTFNSPKGPKIGEKKVIRGGNWGLPKIFAKVITRNAFIPEYKNNTTGFRLAR